MKTREYDIRAAAVSKLLREGVERRDIRIEIPLDTNSSGGRADIVILHDNVLGCVELKSGRDKVDASAISEQLRPYRRAFDYVGVIACHTHSEDKLPYSTLYHFAAEDVIGEKPWKYKPEITDFPIMKRFFDERSSVTSAPDMLSLLWRKEVGDIVGKASAKRCYFLQDWQENKSLAEIRPLVVNALRNRPLNKWEEKFWNSFNTTTTRG